MATDLRPTAVAIAQAFHEAYEELAPSFGYETRKASAVPWDAVPENNRFLMIATVERVLERIAVPVGAAMLDVDDQWKVALTSGQTPIVMPKHYPPLGAPVVVLRDPRPLDARFEPNAPTPYEKERAILQGALDSAWLRMTGFDGSTGDWYAGRYLPVIGDFGADVEVDIYPWWASLDENGKANGWSNGPGHPDDPPKYPTWGWRFNVGWEDFEDNRPLQERVEDLGGGFDDHHVDFIGDPVDSFDVKPTVTDDVAEAYHILLGLDR